MLWHGICKCKQRNWDCRSKSHRRRRLLARGCTHFSSWSIGNVKLEAKQSWTSKPHVSVGCREPAIYLVHRTKPLNPLPVLQKLSSTSSSNKSRWFNFFIMSFQVYDILMTILYIDFYIEHNVVAIFCRLTFFTSNHLW
ncbi:hypothetical protein P3X46_029270 [Hevea brasiliensis]|uniref:Uncharacterized protein n=1 Tax=Hevea brasiliensis TaxID=3981 RepID=A0ABQ9KT51_HEVBR|nr:hypothetical protein P3X46_029270 [Hevea brasiliensis]